MMNREYMKQTYSGNLDAWRAYRAEITAAKVTLSEIIEKHRFGGGTPAQAAQELTQTIGRETACVIIASAVNAHEHDGRLSPEVVKWAQEIGWDWEMSCNLGLCCDNIHMCHINQTAETLMNLPEEPEQPEEQTAEDAQNEEEKTMKNTLEAITRTAATVNEKFAAYIAENLRTVGQLRNHYGMRSYTTPKQCERILSMQDGDSIPADDIAKMIAKHDKGVNASATKAAAQVEQLTAENKPPQVVRLYITWTRNSTWGWNPHVECTAWSEAGSDSTHGTASGCGYDKTSAAAANALNACAMVRAELIRWTENGGSTYGVYTSDTVSYPTVPHFEGGCGMDCITAAFRGMGYEVEQYTHCNRRGNEEFKTYTFTRKEV